MNPRTLLAYLAAAIIALVASSCSGAHATSSLFNDRATLAGALPWNPLQWQVIATLMDNHASTMSVLYGNDLAVRSARRGESYPSGAVLALVTWSKQDDGRWFGARIPGDAKSVEFVSVTAGASDRPANSYEIYQGSPLAKTPAPTPDTRAAYLIALRAAVMP